MATKLLKFGNNVGLIIPALVARKLGFKPGSFVRIIPLERELRIRPVTVPCVDDYVPYEENPIYLETGERYERW